MVVGIVLKPQIEHPGRPERKSLDFIFPLTFQRGGTHDQDVFDPTLLGQDLGGGQALDRLARTHLIGNDRPTRPRGKKGPSCW